MEKLIGRVSSNTSRETSITCISRPFVFQHTKNGIFELAMQAKVEIQLKPHFSARMSAKVKQKLEQPGGPDWIRITLTPEQQALLSARPAKPAQGTAEEQLTDQHGKLLLK
eukprot:g34526.t1